MSKKYKISLSIIGVFLVLTIGLLVYVKIFNKTSDNKKPVVKTSVLDKMDKYGYSLDDRDTKLFKDTYYELKDVLESDNIDYKIYGEKLSELFVIDLFTISNKISKYDVGGLDYLYDSEKEMFKSKVMDTLYDQVEDNSYDNREQKLPCVKSVTVNDVKETNYTVNDKKLNGYVYSIFVEYEEGLGYDTNCNVTVVIDDNIMYIVEYATTK